MQVYLNEQRLAVETGVTAFSLRDAVKKDADIVTLNGFVLVKDCELQEGDRVTLIKRGEIPEKDELEALLVARHTPGVHEKLHGASVGIAGLGGLGSNVAVALARLGIGRLILVDYDVVEPSNLNRQHYFLEHIGIPKTSALQSVIERINPFVSVATKNVYLDKGNIWNCFEEADVIVEAFDKAETKRGFISTVLSLWPEKYLVAASGMAGYESGNSITVKRVAERFYLVGDDVSEAKPGYGLMAPRVTIAANQQANTVLRILLGVFEP